MDVQVSALGAICALAIAIILILKKVSPAYGMITGATVLDHLPHGSFFHATAGSVNMETKERVKMISYETLVGLTITITSTLIFGVFHFFG